MTGRELIIYILENHLEDVDLIKEGKIPGYITADEYAAKSGVGTATVLAWLSLGKVKGMIINDVAYILYGKGEKA